MRDQWIRIANVMSIGVNQVQERLPFAPTSSPLSFHSPLRRYLRKYPSLHLYLIP